MSGGQILGSHHIVHRYSYFLFNQPFSDQVGLYALKGKAGGSISLVGPYFVSVPYYDYPPSAQQPETYATVDTLDTRFQDKTTQVGDHLYAAHCVDFHGYPAVRWYEFDGYSGVTLQWYDIYASAVSNDFNPSITANENEDVVLNWNSTAPYKLNPKQDVYESVRFTSLPSGGSWGTTNRKGKLVTGGTSPTFSYEFRNGDYSTTVVDPNNHSVFWGINQTMLNSFEWNTWIFDVQFP